MTCFLCKIGIHKWVVTPWLTDLKWVTAYRKARHRIDQCSRCCKVRKGAPYLGVVDRKPSDTPKLLACKND